MYVCIGWGGGGRGTTLTKNIDLSWSRLLYNDKFFFLLSFNSKMIFKVESLAERFNIRDAINILLHLFPL